MLSGRHQPVKRQLMMGCLKSAWQFILQKSLRPRVFHSVLHPLGSLNQNPQKYPHILLQLKIPTRYFWQWECEESIKLILST